MLVTCDNCGKEFYKRPSHITNFNYCCMECLGEHRKTLYKGQKNPNSRYKIDENFMSTIDTEFKAWLLGWICSDGNISGGRIQISIHEQDVDVLHKIASHIDKKLPIVHRKENMVTLTINSRQWCKDILRHLNLKREGKKCYNLATVNIENNMLRHFIRGVIEGDGHIDVANPKVTITSCSKKFLEFISEKSGFPATINQYKKCFCASFNSVNGLDLLGWCYEGSKYFMNRKIEAYRDLCTWTPILRGPGKSTRIDGFYVAKTLENAVFPSKIRVSDSGYDLTIVDIWKTVGNVIFYDTGIRVKPPFGYFFMVVPRSSLSKTGYILVNSVGIIDRSYTGSIKVALQKVNESMPDLELPARLVQLIPIPAVHIEPIYVDSLEETSRGEGGFGSTNNNENGVI